MKPATLTLIFLVSLFACFGQQQKIDSLKKSIHSQSGLEKVKSLNELAWYYKNSNVDSSLYFSRLALQISESEDSMEGISQSYNSLANGFEAIGLLDSALFYHDLSFHIKSGLGDSLGMAASLNNLGITYDELGNYSKSLEHYFQALAIYEVRSDDPYDVAMVLGNIGIVYKKQKEYEKVLEYYERALDIYEEVGSEFGQTVTNGNISGVLLMTGDYREAIAYAEKARSGYEKQGYTRYIPYAEHNLAIAYDSLKYHEKAYELFKSAVQGHQEHNNTYELASTYIGLASNQRSIGNFKKGIDFARLALQAAMEADAKEFIAKAKLELSINLSRSGDFRRAYQNLASYQVLNDSLFEDSKTRQIFELQTQYETEKKEQQIALQEARIAEQTAQLDRNRLLLIASVLAIVMIVAIALLQRSRLKKKQQLRLQEVQLKTREAEINATISSQEKERARYARDLHDGFGQMISILNMNLQNLEEKAKPAERQKVFEESSRVINEMYGELKNICFDLMPQTLIQSGLESALEEFVNRINSAGKVFVELNVFGLEERLSELQEISLYRISQEWINNVIKYSDATKMTLQITKDADEITLLIEDDGTGFDKTRLMDSKGNGWKNLNTRTNLMKGALELETTPGQKGNTLIVNAPAQIITIHPEQNTVKTV